jgi:hypothetical protein
MKKLYALLLGMALVGQTIAKPVDVNAAKAVGYSFLSRNTPLELESINDLQTVYTATANINGVGTSCYYVFNTTNGFVMVAADDNIEPILGFSNESQFVVVGIPQHVQWWFDGYTQQISYVIKNNLTGERGITEQWRALTTASNAGRLAKTTDVAPLLTTLAWDQTPYYDALCPGAGAQKSVTGCVATAMAQVMKFWNWPAVGAGTNAYTPDIVAAYGVQTVNFGATAYQWSSMPVALTGTTTAAQNSAVATLMYHCGVAVDMNYNTAANNGSGAYVEQLQSTRPNCAEFALKSYFKYSPAMHGDSRAQYASTAAWVAALKADIDGGRPVLYTGSGSDGGHCWVADGYKVMGTSTTFHFNWGWSGQSNAYFTVDNLAPPALGTGGGNGNFNSNQGAIFGIKPRTVTANTGSMKLDAPIAMPTSYTRYLQPFTMAANILNNTGAAFTGQLTAEIFDINDNLVTTLPAVNATIANGSTSGSVTFTPSSENLWRMVPGIYIAHIYYKNTGGSWTIAGDNASYINYATTEVADDNGLLLDDSLACAGGRVLQNGQTVKMTTTVMNLTGTDYTGTLDASIWDPTTQTAVFDIQQLANTSIAYGSKKQVTFTSTATLNIPGGSYVLMTGDVSSQGFSPLGALYYSNPITVVVPARAAVNNVAAASDIQVYPNPAADMVKVDLKGVDASSISLLDITGRILTTIVPAANTIATIPVEKFATGIYLVQVQTAGGVITKKITITK